MKIKERLYRFMYGRYGSDQLNFFLMILYVVISFWAIFIENVWLHFFLRLLALGLFVYVCFRMFSRKIYARQMENQVYLMLKRKVGEYFKYLANRWKFRKTHVYKKCPQCNIRLKLPRKKGRHNVKCPKCSKNFSVDI